jgi:5-oxoprolinase (ATP-hydrolysing)
VRSWKLGSWAVSNVFPKVFITNDPYEVEASAIQIFDIGYNELQQGGISHLNDMLVMLPVYFEGKRVAWTANQGHFTECVIFIPP